MNYVNTKKIPLPAKDWVLLFNSLVNKSGYKVIEDETVVVPKTIILRDGLINSSFIIKKDGHLLEYITKKDNTEEFDLTSAKSAMNSFLGRKAINGSARQLTENKINISTANYTSSGIIKFNPLFSGCRKTCYYYDINSAWSSFMIKQVPDFRKEPLRFCKVGKNQIGFTSEGKLVRSGKACWVFDLIDTPEDIVSWVKKWFALKKSTNKLEKVKAKKYLNMVIGCLQNTQPLWRSWIIEQANEYVSKYWDPDTVLYINTDCVISTVPIPEIEANIGSEIGKWKKEICTVAIKQTASGWIYQKNLDLPVWRGMPKSAIIASGKAGVDILDYEGINKDGSVFWKYNKITMNYEELTDENS